MLAKPVDMHMRCERSHACTQRPRAVTALAADKGGTRLVAAYSDSTLCVFSGTRPDRGSLAAFRGHDATTFYTKIAISPDGSHIASASADRAVYVWNCSSHATSHVVGASSAAVEPCAVMRGHSGDVTGVDWSHCHDTWDSLASCADDGTIRVWSIQRPEWPTRRGADTFASLRLPPVADDAPEPPACDAAPAPLQELSLNAGAPVEAPPVAAKLGGENLAAGALLGVVTPHPQQHPVPLARGTANTAAGGPRTLLVRTLTAFYGGSEAQPMGEAPPTGPPARVHIALKRSRGGSNKSSGVARRIETPGS